MRDLEANLQPIFYAMYVGEKDVLDKKGRPTGKKAPIYTNPRPFRVFVSTPSGEKKENPFGGFADYDKVMSTANADFKADEYSVYWIDTIPVLKEDGSTDTPFDYKTKRVAMWGGQKAYAISKIAENVDIFEYLKKLISNGSISQEEYDKYVAVNTEDGDDEDTD